MQVSKERSDPAPQQARAGLGVDSLSLAVVCPMANEAESAQRFILEVMRYCRPYGFRRLSFVSVLDKVSTDGTLDLLRSLESSIPELRTVYAPDNRCVVDAYCRGYREALALGADWILEMDAGFSHLPDQIPRFLDQIAPDIDCVFATRFAHGGVYEGGIGRRFLVSWIGSSLARTLLGLKLTDLTSGFQLFSRAALQRIVDRGLVSRGPFFQTEIKACLKDLNVREVPISYVPTGQVVRTAALHDALRVLALLFAQRFPVHITQKRLP
jgi:dolichol-phosphate mannosyltransferase